MTPSSIRRHKPPRKWITPWLFSPLSQPILVLITRRSSVQIRLPQPDKRLLIFGLGAFFCIFPISPGSCNCVSSCLVGFIEAANRRQVTSFSYQQVAQAATRHKQRPRGFKILPLGTDRGKRAGKWETHASPSCLPVACCEFPNSRHNFPPIQIPVQSSQLMWIHAPWSLRFIPRQWSPETIRDLFLPPICRRSHSK